MKRSVLSIMLLIAVLFSMVMPVGAATELDSFFEEKGLGARFNAETGLYEETIDVPLSVSAKKSSDSDDKYAAEASDSRYASEAAPTFDFKASLSMEKVENAFNGYVVALTTKGKAVESLPVTGEFTITVDYDEDKSGMVEIPDNYQNALVGFNFGTDSVYEEADRKLDDGSLTNYKRAVIKVNLKDGVKVSDIQNTSKTSLHEDIAFICNGVSIRDLNADHKFTVNFDGFIQVSSLAKISFQTVEGKPSAATVTVYKKSTGSSGGNRGGSVVTDDTFTVVFNIDGKGDAVDSIEVSKNGTVNFDTMTYPTKEGYAFDGYYLDANFTQKAEGEVKITKDTTFYARWKKIEEPGELNTEDHFAYIAGYPDGEIKPFNNITREEVATIFYRLLKEEKRNTIHSTANDFSDVESSRWSNEAVSTMAKGGYIVGYEDGTFRPEEYITRAEFVTIVARFNDAIITEGTPFIDIAGHWAEKYIITAAKQGWIDGYSDGTFKPDVNITRADAIQIVNRLLVRYVNKAGLHENAKQWPDNLESSKYYYDILEATNSHEYERQEDDYNETWTNVLDESLIIDKTFSE